VRHSGFSPFHFLSPSNRTTTTILQLCLRHHQLQNLHSTTAKLYGHVLYVWRVYNRTESSWRSEEQSLVTAAAYQYCPLPFTAAPYQINLRLQRAVLNGVFSTPYWPSQCWMCSDIEIIYSNEEFHVMVYSFRHNRHAQHGIIRKSILCDTTLTFTLKISTPPHTHTHRYKLYWFRVTSLTSPNKHKLAPRSTAEEHISISTNS